MSPVPALARCLPRHHSIRPLAAACCSALLLASCGGGGDDDPPVATEPPPAAEEEAPASMAYAVDTTIGPEGGSLTGPDGARLVVPADELQLPMFFGIERLAELDFDYDLLLPPVGTPYLVQAFHRRFTQPATIRLPVPPGVANPVVLMTGAAMDLSRQDAVIADGFASVPRAHFGFFHSAMGMVVDQCATSPDATADRCFAPHVQVRASAFPQEALVHVGAPAGTDGFAGTLRVVAPALLRFSATYQTWPSCTTAHVSLVRQDRVGANVDTLAEQTVALQPEHGGERGAGGSTTFAPILLTALSRQEQYLYGVRVRCERADGAVTRHGDDLSLAMAIAPNSMATQVPIQVTGVVGSGLVLRNLGSNDVVASSNATYFLQPHVDVGTPYEITVASAPAGQTCTVANATGLARTSMPVNAFPTVTCSATP